MYIVRWALWIEAKSHQKAERVLGIVQERMALALDDLESERYWKDMSRFRATFRTRLDSARSAEAMCETLLIASLIADNWTVGTPEQFSDGEFEWHGYRNAQRAPFKVPGLIFATFDLQSDDNRGTELLESD